MEKSEVLGLLKGVDLFSSLSDSQIEVISKAIICKEYTKEQRIILEDDTNDEALFIIGSGQVEVYLSGIDGRETILALLEKADFFGEMSLIDGEPRSASVKATQKSEMLILKRSDFLQKLKEYPDLSMSLLEEMCRRFRKSNRQINSLASLSVYGRIANTLLNLIEEKGVRVTTENNHSAIAIRNKPTQQQLAEMSGTTRESVSRVLNSLQKKGMISINGKDLIVLDEDALNPKH